MKTNVLLGWLLLASTAWAAPEVGDAVGATHAGGGSVAWSAHRDIATLSGNSGALVFWLFAALMVAGSLFVVTRKNLVTAVMGMVGTFFGIGVAYMLLYASFLSVMQMLVYAGAIMVLFVFVIMILNRPEEEPVARGYTLSHVLSAVGIVYLLARMTMLLTSINVPMQAGVPATNFPPPDVMAMEGKTQVAHAFGSTKAVGTELFGHYLFPFEAISLVLLVAVIGAVAVARPLRAEAAEHNGGAS